MAMMDVLTGRWRRDTKTVATTKPAPPEPEPRRGSPPSPLRCIARRCHYCTLLYYTVRTWTVRCSVAVAPSVTGLYATISNDYLSLSPRLARERTLQIVYLRLNMYTGFLQFLDVLNIAGVPCAGGTRSALLHHAILKPLLTTLSQEYLGQNLAMPQQHCWNGPLWRPTTMRSLMTLYYEHTIAGSKSRYHRRDSSLCTCMRMPIASWLQDKTVRIT